MVVLLTYKKQMGVGVDLVLRVDRIRVTESRPWRLTATMMTMYAAGKCTEAALTY